ncbi:MAG: hypothetical protein ABI641_08685 [Caldimonas sp.]
MKPNHFAILLATLAWSVTQAQPAGVYDGIWTVTFDGSRTAGLQGTVVIKDGAGTWKVQAEDRKNPCVGRESPITVKTASADELVFEVNRSKMLAGCKDFTMKFRKVDDKAMAGKTIDGRAVSLVRQ